MTKSEKHQNRNASTHLFSFSSSRGFTLIELVFVITIIAVLGATLSLRVGSRASNSLPFQADTLARNIRHAQILALTWGESLRIDVAGGNSYAVSCVTATGKWPCLNNPVRNADGKKPFVVALKDGVSITGPTLAFDSYGRPIDPATGLLTSVTRNMSLVASGETWRVDVSPVTGFVSMVRL